MHALRALFDRLEPIPDTEWRWLQSHVYPRSFAPGERLFSEGGTDRGMHYIAAGLVRYYHTSEDGRELNHAFASVDNLVACMPVLAGQPRCPLNVEAIEATDTHYIDAEAIAAFHTRHACWAHLYARLMEHVALRKARRERELLEHSAEQRYRTCLAEYETLIDRIPQYHLAAYIGITPVALSRIRKRINPG